MLDVEHQITITTIAACDLNHTGSWFVSRFLRLTDGKIISEMFSVSYIINATSNYVQ